MSEGRGVTYRDSAHLKSHAAGEGKDEGWEGICDEGIFEFGCA